MPLRAETLREKITKRVRRLVPNREFCTLQKSLRGGRGIEIGGPSAVFRRWNLWPLYPVLKTLDIYNFAPETIWSASEPTRPTFGAIRGRIPHGQLLIGEAALMNDVESSAYQCLLASHVLEHIANPLKALKTWKRVIGPAGTLILVVPHRDGTFDHRRPVTSLDHIVDDFLKDVPETDNTHIHEILDLHDLTRDPGAGTREAFVTRAKNNIRYRSLHHHVFDTELVLKVVDTAGLRILYLDLELPYHICVACSWKSVTEGTAGSNEIRNSATWSPEAEWRLTSPFPSDRPVALCAVRAARPGALKHSR